MREPERTVIVNFIEGFNFYTDSKCSEEYHCAKYY